MAAQKEVKRKPVKQTKAKPAPPTTKERMSRIVEGNDPRYHLG